MNGTVKRLKPRDGYGFIRGEDGKDYFFHHKSLKNAKIEELVEEQEVTFEDVEGPKGPRAEDVYV